MSADGASGWRSAIRRGRSRGRSRRSTVTRRGGRRRRASRGRWRASPRKRTGSTRSSSACRRTSTASPIGRDGRAWSRSSPRCVADDACRSSTEDERLTSREAESRLAVERARLAAAQGEARCGRRGGHPPGLSRPNDRVMKTVMRTLARPRRARCGCRRRAAYVDRASREPYRGYTGAEQFVEIPSGLRDQRDRRAPRRRRRRPRRAHVSRRAVDERPRAGG